MDLIPLLITLCGCLLWKLEYGILLGIGLNLIEIFYLSAKAPLTFKVVDENLHISLGNGLSYPAANQFRNKIENYIREKDYSENYSISLDLSRLTTLDYTALNSLCVRY